MVNGACSVLSHCFDRYREKQERDGGSTVATVASMVRGNSRWQQGKHDGDGFWVWQWWNAAYD